MKGSGGGWIRRASAWLLAAVLVASAGSTRAGAQSPGALAGGGRHTAARRAEPGCELCHGQLEFLRQHTSTLARAESLKVSFGALSASGHNFACTKCHSGFGSFPHVVARTSTKACSACHPSEAADWSAGSHAHVDRGKPTGCTDCHHVHEVPTRARLGSPATVATMNERCLGCHDTRRYPASSPHAQVLCAACHGAHDVRGHDRPGSKLAPAAQVRTCGACHPAEARSFSHDAHGRALLGARHAKADGEDGHGPPTCTTCHGGHDLVRPKQAAAGTGPDAACTRCHEKYADTFADSYHGQATALGSRRVARCSGCHTAHMVLPADSPRSSVAQGNLLHTCRSCHPQATKGFIAYQPHADVHDRAKSPLLHYTYAFMTVLLTGTMLLFGLHGLLWLVRLGVGRAAARGRKQPAGTATHGGDE